MVVKRGHAQSVIECSRHRSIYFVFEKNRVAHHHRAIFCFDERGPGAESHEWRHRPSIDNDLHVVTGESDFVNPFLLVQLPFEAGEIVDLRGIKRSQRAQAHRGKNRRQGKKLFHW